MVMFSHATSHANRSKKNTITRRTTSLPAEAVVIPQKPEIIGKDKNGNNPCHLPTKQPVFAQRRMNRNNSMVETYSPEHEGIVKYLSYTWGTVSKELEKKGHHASEDGVGGPVYYIEKESNPLLKDFTNFELDHWMSTRMYQKLTGTP